MDGETTPPPPPPPRDRESTTCSLFTSPRLSRIVLTIGITQHGERQNDALFEEEQWQVKRKPRLPFQRAPKRNHRIFDHRVLPSPLRRDSNHAGQNSLQSPILPTLDSTFKYHLPWHTRTFQNRIASFPLSIHKQSPSLIQTRKRPLSSPIPLPIPPLPLPLSSPFSTSPSPTLSITHTPSPFSSP
jgi:hypothetical protein